MIDNILMLLVVAGWIVMIYMGIEGLANRR